MNKKDLIPLIIASIIALGITCLARWLLPTNVSTVAVKDAKDEIPMPDIPLMARDKTKKKSWDVHVLVVSKDIKKGEKISAQCCDWKKWPSDDLLPYFIAKDREEVPMNNVADYGKAMKMWAKNDIPHGIPLTIQMLDDMDPAKRAEEEKKKKQEEEKKEAQKVSEAYIKKGMRAVTLVVDQKSSVFNNMVYPGDIIDVLIMDSKGDRTKTYKYKALTVLAVDGSTSGKRKTAKKEDSEQAHSAAGSPIRNITLEVKEDMVEVMINQSSATGIVISIRNQDEEVDDSEVKKDTAEDAAEDAAKENNNESDNFIVNDILNISRQSSVEKLLEKKSRTQSEENLMNDILDIGRKSSAEKLLEKKTLKDEGAKNEEVLMNDILDIGRKSSAEKLLEKKSLKDDKSNDEEVLMSDIIDINRRSSAEKLLEKKAHNDDKSRDEEVLMSDIIDINRRSSAEKLLEKKALKDEGTKNEEVLMNDILDIGRKSSAEKLLEKKAHNDDEEKNNEILMSDILDINRKSSTEKLLEKKAQNDEEEKKAETIMSDILDVNRKSSTEKLMETRARNEAEASNAELLINNINSAAGLYSNRSEETLDKKFKNNGNEKGIYEIVSGKVMGDETKHGDEKRAVIYKKLTAQEVKFDKNGNVSDARAAGK
ncbi:hypothetical protein FACS1894122_10190 [Alphaproteobacteria bacterium]|nr:hypothetical protein FACS1894122_10190 [Alphaproteobacteria bacterium]